MLSVLIVEDEYEAAQRLHRMLMKWEPNTRVIGIADSIEKSVAILKSGNTPDLILLDIHIADGISFEIFEQVDVQCSVILTTAYDEYWQKSFELNSIDYLLKPISEDRLFKSLNKFRKLFEIQANRIVDSHWLRSMNSPKTRYRIRFLVDMGLAIGMIAVEQIAYFLAKEKLIEIHTFDGNHYQIKTSLDQLEEELEPRTFFRANRQVLVAARSIVKLHQYFNYKVKLELNPKTDTEIVISRQNVTAFKEWLSLN